MPPLRAPVLVTSEVNHVLPPSADCSTTYPVITPPPSVAGTRHSNDIVSAVTPVMVRSRGTPGTSTCHGTALTEPEAAPVPIAFMALTRKE